MCVCVCLCKWDRWWINYSLQRTDVSAKFHQWNVWYCGLVQTASPPFVKSTDVAKSALKYHLFSNIKKA